MGYGADNGLGKELKRLRKENRFTQEEIAGRLHITRQTYSHYETGRIKPPIKNLLVLNTLYNVPLSDFLKYMDINLEHGNLQSMQEEELISYYRKLTGKEKDVIWQTLEKIFRQRDCLEGLDA